MCGRYVSVRSGQEVLDAFDAVDATGDDPIEPDYNVAPTKPVFTIVNRALRDTAGTPAATPTRQLRVMSWGLVPSWAKDRRGAGRMINARVETVATAPAFRRAYAARRCLIPADGWYEWRAVDGPSGPQKQPMYMTPEDGHVLAFAGLYEFWRGPDGTLSTCTIITAAAEGALAEVHDRMPLVLPRVSWARWLDPTVADPAELLAARDEAAGEQLELRPVSTEVNKVEHAGPQLVRRVEPPNQPQRLF